MPADKLSIDKNVTIASIFLAVRRNLWLVGFVTLFFAVAVVGITLSAEPQYESNCSIWVHRKRSLVETSPLSAPEPSPTLISAFLSSRTTRLQVARALNLSDREEFWGEPPEETDEKAAADKIDELVEIVEVRGRPMVEVIVRSRDPQVAFELVSALVQAAIQRSEELQNKESKFLQEQLAQRREAFHKAIERVNAFQKKSGIVTDPATQSEVFYQTSMRLRESLLKAEAERAGVNQMLNAPTDFEEQLDLIARQDGLQGTADYLKSFDDEAQDVMKSFPDTARDYKILQADVITQQELLKQTALTAELAKFEAAAQAPNIIIVEDPQLPKEPINELPIRIVLGLVFGVAIGLVLAAIREALGQGFSDNALIETERAIASTD
jgi:uncharacterized protein involved in exopolysaccharide biosynthesis